MHIRIYYYSPTNPGGFSQPFTGAAGTIWQGMAAAEENRPPDYYVDFGWRQWEANHPEIQTTGVQSGGIVVYDWDRQRALLVMAPNTTSAAIGEKLKLVYQVEYSEESGYVNSDGSSWGTSWGQSGSDGTCFFVDLPIIGNMLAFLCELEKYIFMGLTAFAVLKTAESATQGGKAAWGTVATFGAYKTAKAYNLLKMSQKHLLIGGIGLVALLLLLPGEAGAENTTPEDVDFSYLGMSGIPRGMRNNNPLNIKINSANQWQGRSTPNTDGVFEQFVSYKWGIRAAMVLLRNYMEQGRDSVQAIISKWAPVDSGENNPTNTYISHVAGYMGVSPTDRLGFNYNNIANLVIGMASFENGTYDAVTPGQALAVWNEFFEPAVGSMASTRRPGVNLHAYVQI